ncbi:MAG: hypothetical protein D6694_14680 [Gammaproteobacteria bacterium]|nr:MAG: hypothetical protein D6694_14680 [Gammaproteobacteria bacterium]
MAAGKAHSDSRSTAKNVMRVTAPLCALHEMPLDGVKGVVRTLYETEDLSALFDKAEKLVSKWDATAVGAQAKARPENQPAARYSMGV